ncbi:MAG TPA: TIGR04282 family arsenosugar biosynthesis glycosyltransferase [Ktedonobacteraceae bacterium]
MPGSALVVMARYPEVGKTKTRLARAIGHDEATSLYQAFLTDLAQRFSRGEDQLHWCYTPTEADFSAYIATFAPSLAQHTHCFPQEGADLGARLLSAFQWTREHDIQRTIVISSDSPHISQEIIGDARAALNTADIVLGPAEDGGYYLIAMGKPHDVFSGIPMSTSVVMQMTIELAQSQGLTVHLLKPLFDIDELPDLLRLARLLVGDSTLAPVTAAHLTHPATLRRLHDHNIHSYTATFNLHRADKPL